MKSDQEGEAEDRDVADLEIEEGEVEEAEAAGLTPKEMLFCYAYGDPESPSFGQRTKSARVAGYSGPRSAAWKLLKRPKVEERLSALHKSATAAIGRCMANLEHIRLLAEKKGDLRVAARCAELQGRHLAAFADVVAVDLPACREYTETEQIEARRLARLLLEEDEEPVIAGALAAPSDTDQSAQDAQGGET